MQQLKWVLSEQRLNLAEVINITMSEWLCWAPAVWWQPAPAEAQTDKSLRRYPAASCPICFEDLQQPGDTAAPGPGNAMPQRSASEPPSAPPLPGAAGPSSGKDVPAESPSKQGVKEPLLGCVLFARQPSAHRPAGSPQDYACQELQSREAAKMCRRCFTSSRA